MMKPELEIRILKRPGQNGFSIVSAIFLVVILSAMGVFMMKFATVQHVTVAQDIQSVRAYQAARAGLEWGIFKTGVSTGTRLTVCPGGGITSSIVLPALSNDLATFSVTVTCAVQLFTESATNDVIIFTITSTATSGQIGKPERIERRLEVRL